MTLDIVYVASWEHYKKNGEKKLSRLQEMEYIVKPSECPPFSPQLERSPLDRTGMFSMTGGNCSGLWPISAVLSSSPAVTHGRSLQAPYW